MPTGEPEHFYPCDDVLVAIGQENAFPWIERDIGLEWDKWGMPKVDTLTMQSNVPTLFFGGDAAFGPKNIIWAVAHGHDAAVSIDKFCQGEDLKQRPDPMTNLVSQKMGIHEWSYDNDISEQLRNRVPWKDKKLTLKDIKVEVELGFDAKSGFRRGAALPELRCANRVLGKNCVSSATPASISARWIASPSRPMLKKPSCASNSTRRRCHAKTQDLYISTELKMTGRIMAKDEDVCLHCGLCAERCPTGAWDMQKYLIEMTHAGPRLQEQTNRRSARLHN